jgi:chromosome segregation ATPase
MDKLGKGEGNGPTAEDFENELQMSASAFDALERDFQQVLGDLMVDESLEKFRIEYEKLHRALKKSHEQEKRLVKKCKELNNEIINNQAKIKTALRLSQDDQKTITHLQKEMEKTWKLVYASQEKETMAKATIAQLKEEMVNLSKLVEKGAGLSLTQENLVKELKQAKEELQRQVDEKASAVVVLETQLVAQHKVQQELRNERDEHLKLINEFRERMAAKESDNIREIKRREKTQKELQDARTRLEDHIKREEELLQEINKYKTNIHDLEKQLVDGKTGMEKVTRELETATTRSTKLSEEVETAHEKHTKLLTQLHELEKDIKLKHIEIGRITTEKSLLERKVDKEHRNALHYQQVAEEMKTPLQIASNEIESLKKELLSAHKHELDLVRTTDKIVHEKEISMKNFEKQEQRTREKEDIVFEKERIIKTLNVEITSFRQEISRLRKTLYDVEKDRERLSNEVTEHRSHFLALQEDCKLRDIQISELNKNLLEKDVKLKQLKQMCDSLRADRNHYSKGLLESQDQIAELDKKFKIMEHQIEQLNDEIHSKDQAIAKESFEFQKADKQREIKENECQKLMSLNTKNLELIRQQEMELKSLSGTLSRMDEEAFQQRKEYDQVINERDILGTQLIRRNDELALLYEKLRIQQSAMKKGEAHYLQRVQDIRLLKIKLQDLNRENALNKGSGPQVEEMKREILQLQRELLQEKTKVTALSEELENPMNVHRWRKLEGSDPATFELIQKIQTLQRRLIAKTEEVVEKGLMIQEKEKLYQELKAILARQPGPEIAEQLSVYQLNLKKKNAQLKAMASELNMYQAQVNEYKYEQERLQRELTELKRKYYQQKKKEKLLEDLEFDQSLNQSNNNHNNINQANHFNANNVNNIQNPTLYSRTTPAMLQNQQIVAAKSARTKFTGGGFAIK